MSLLSYSNACPKKRKTLFEDYNIPANEMEIIAD